MNNKKEKPLDKKEDNLKIEEEVELSNTDNIFDELSWDLDFWDDLEGEWDKKKKDKYFFMKIWGTITQVLNVILFLIVWLGIYYVSIWKDETFNNWWFLDPVCKYIVGDSYEKLWTCWSALYFKKDYEEKEKKLKEEITQKILKIIPEIYAIENFSLSREIVFLVDKSKNRLKPLKILEEFDNLKKTYTQLDKWKITCENVEIKQWNVLTLSCSAFSTMWNDKIIWFDAEVSSKNKFIWWTSVTLAASFLNYIEKSSKNFKVLNKQKNFTSSDYTWEGYYVKRTDFDLSLQYIENNINTLNVK